MKEMYVKLPVIEMSGNDFYRAKYYPKSGRYIVRFPNEDIGVIDVILKNLPEGCERPDDENAESYNYTYIGQPKLYSEEELVEAETLKQCRKDLAKTNQELSKVCYDWQEKIDKLTAENDDAIKKLKEDQQAELENKDAQCAAVIDNLHKEFELEKKRYELEQPKRNGQGEWVSGKTLTEIIRTLTEVKRKDVAFDNSQRVVTTLLEIGDYAVQMGCTALSYNDGTKVKVEPITLK